MLVEPRPDQFLPSLQPNTFNRFQRLSENKGTKLTIAMGFYCKDGVVIAADRRGTSGNEVSEVEKIFQFTPTGLVAFSGNDYTWIKEFQSYLYDAKGNSDIERVRSALREYERYVEKRFGKKPPGLVDFEGIFASCEGNPVIAEFGFWRGFDYGGEDGRLVIGSAGTTAKVFIRMAEFAQKQADYTPWKSLSTGLVATFCH